jgi:uncharacterized damage-inducible protein DinB
VTVQPTAQTEAELDQRHPERVQARAMQTADEYRAMWTVVEGLWSDTLARAERLPEATRQERVNDEWSLVETLRHLIFATDLWAGHMVLGHERPFHPLGLPPSDYPPEDVPPLDLEAKPGYAQVVATRAERQALMRAVLDGLTDAEMKRIAVGLLPAAWEEEPPTIGTCLRVVMEEEIEHRRYALRDLAALERE